MVFLVALCLTAAPIVVHTGSAKEGLGGGRARDVRVLVPLFCLAPDGGFPETGCMKGRPAITQLKVLDGEALSTTGIRVVREEAFNCGDVSGGEACAPTPLWTLAPWKPSPASEAAPPLSEDEPPPARAPADFLSMLGVWPARAAQPLKLTAGRKQVALPKELTESPQPPAMTKSPFVPPDPTVGDVWTIELRDERQVELLVTSDAVAHKAPGEPAFHWSTHRAHWGTELVGAFTLEGVDAPILVLCGQHPPGFWVQLVELSNPSFGLGSWGEPDF